MEETFTVKTVTEHDIFSFGPAGRALDSLNRIARLLYNAGSTEPTKAMAPLEIASHLGMDRSNCIRLMKDRPGFVKVVRFEKGHRTVGYYYLSEFKSEAQRQANGYYPWNTTTLCHERWPKEQTVTVADSPVQHIKYQGKSKTGDPVLVPTVILEGNLLEKALQNYKMIFPAISEGLHENLEHIRQGEELELKTLESNLITLLSVYSWIRNSVGRPENALILHEIRKENNE